MVFEIDNIDLAFGQKQILHAVYLKAETGKVTGILGRNGSGKSCLLRIIFGNLKARNKLLRIDQKPFLKKPYKTGIVRFLPQHIFLPKQLSIGKIFNLFRVDWSEFCRYFDGFSLYQNHTPKELSGGELRVVQVYLLLKSPCQLLLLDEPFSHIAPVYVEKIKNLIEEEKPQKAIILTDHNYRETLEVANDLYLLREGYAHKIKSEENLRQYHYLPGGF